MGQIFSARAALITKISFVLAILHISFNEFIDPFSSDRQIYCKVSMCYKKLCPKHNQKQNLLKIIYSVKLLTFIAKNTKYLYLNVFFGNKMWL